jgi:uncharacterized protein YbjT (DUF2867 family)
MSLVSSLVFTTCALLNANAPRGTQQTAALSSRRAVLEQSIALGSLAPAIRLSALLPVAVTTAIVTAPGRATAAPAELKKVVVIGGSGFVGTRVCEQLVGRGVSVVSISRGGRPASAAPWADKVEWVAADAGMDSKALNDAMAGASAAISAAGVIFGNGLEADRANNARPNVAATDAASAAGVSRYVYVSVSGSVEPVVAPLLGGGYFLGKQDAETEILGKFGASNSLIIKPTFIYGGNAFGLSPPRVNGAYGGLVDVALSSGPIRALAGISPGPLKLVLEPPVSVDAVAAAAVAGALGLASGSVDGHDAIAAAAKLLAN